MTDVVMPQMGESIVEGTLTKWLKKPGERVERDEPLFEISTDKVDTEIPSPAAGTLSEVLVEEGKTVGINTIVARIDEGGGAAAAPSKARRAAAGTETPSQETIQPDARRAAADRGRRSGDAAPGPEARGLPAEPAGPISPLVRKNGPREQHRSFPREGQRRRRTHHQAGYGGAHRAGPGAGRSRRRRSGPARREARRSRSAAPLRPAAAPAAGGAARPASSPSARCARRSPSTWCSPSAPRRTSPPSIAST